MKITKLAPSTKKKGRWLCHLEDGTILRVGEGELLSFSLYAGMELEEDTLAQLAAAAQLGQVRSRALNLLAARPYGSSELLKKLADREVDPALAAETVQWLVGLGLIDDAAYAATLVRHYGTKGYGIYKLKEELYRRGVPKSLWDDALAQEEEGTDALDALLRRKLQSVDLEDRKALKRVTDALARRGFRWEEIRAALRRYGADVIEE